MSFREQSAWLMATLLTAAGLYYAATLWEISQALGAAAPPRMVIALVIGIVVGIVAAELLLELISSEDPDAPADERERMIQRRAGAWGGRVLGLGVLWSLGYYVAHADGNMLFHMVLLSLILSQVADYGLQVVLFRRML